MKIPAKGLFQCSCCKHCKNEVNLLDFTETGIADRREKCAKCADRPPLAEAFSDLVAGYIYLDCKNTDKEFKEHATKVRQLVKRGYGIRRIAAETGISEAKVRRAIDIYGLRYEGKENLGRENKRKNNMRRKHKTEPNSTETDKRSE